MRENLGQSSIKGVQEAEIGRSSVFVSISQRSKGLECLEEYNKICGAILLEKQQIQAAQMVETVAD
ncbi:hypothetical protein HispidOSU_008196, partial [Sigmodon hispidus]